MQGTNSGAVCDIKQPSDGDEPALSEGGVSCNTAETHYLAAWLASTARTARNTAALCHVTAHLLHHYLNLCLSSKNILAQNNHNLPSLQCVAIKEAAKH